jgi:ligand-binding SRPBCC domain-containing protein
VLERAQVVPVPVEEAFAFFADARNLERITPEWLRFRIVEALTN